MKAIKSYYAVTVLLTLCGFASCSGGSGDKESTQAAKQHAAMRASLRDSVTHYAARVESLQARINELQPAMDSLLTLFEMDIRPEYVEHYRVARGWSGYDTMAATGILARLTENGTPELIASYKGGKFNALELSDGVNKCALSVVTSPDLNYTVGGVTRVAFMGDEVLAFCRFVADNEGESLKVRFVGGNAGSIELTQAQKSMLALMARAIDTQKEIDELNRGIMVAFNKQQLYANEVRSDSIKAAANTAK